VLIAISLEMVATSSTAAKERRRGCSAVMGHLGGWAQAMGFLGAIGCKGAHERVKLSAKGSLS